MNDLIRREDVIEIFSQLWDCIEEIADKDEWEDVCKTTVNELSSTPQWVPCSERLPKTSKWRTDFIVTTDNGSVLTMEWENTSVRGEEVSRWVWHDRVNLPWKIIAWMELPNPYTESENQ